jgi:N-acyl-D-aspartate/D-glutamate deacylase
MLMMHPPAENLVMQGITTFVGGNCGITLAPIWKRTLLDLMEEQLGLRIPTDWNSFDEWLGKVEEVGAALNYVPIVGHHAIRGSVLGEDFKRESTPAEIEEMKELVDEAMRAGAHGMSSFADPSIGEYASMDELVELVKVAGSYRGFYMPHTRHIQSQWYSDDPEEMGYGIFHGPAEDAWVGRYRGYLEAIEIGRRSATPVHIAHYSTAFKIPQPHPDELDAAAARATLAIIDDARAGGVDVTFDVIPCTSSISGKTPVIGAFSRWLEDGGNDALVTRMKTEAFRREAHEVYSAGRLKVCMINTKADPYWFNRLRILEHVDTAYAGKTIGEITDAKGCHPLDTLIELVIEDPGCKWVQFEDDRGMPAATPVYLQHQVAMPSSDAIYVLPIAPPEVDEMPMYGVSPIMFGLYAHYLETYVREQEVLSLEDAVHKATQWPAERFGLTDRGILREGAFADMVVFDPETIRMTGDFDNPACAPEGIALTVVNGRVVYDGEKHTGDLPGRVLRRTGSTE